MIMIGVRERVRQCAVRVAVYRLVDVCRIAAGRGNVDHARQRARAHGAALDGLRARERPATRRSALMKENTPHVWRTYGARSRV